MKNLLSAMMITVGLGLTVSSVRNDLGWWAIIPMVIFVLGMDLRYLSHERYIGDE